jgi:hypothetical protein
MYRSALDAQVRDVAERADPDGMVYRSVRYHMDRMG